MESERVALANECRLSIADVWNCEIRLLAMSASLVTLNIRLTDEMTSKLPTAQYEQAKEWRHDPTQNPSSSPARVVFLSWEWGR